MKTQDGGQPWIITLPILDRTYYNRFGWIYNPRFEHLFADTEMSHVADLLGRKIDLPITFRHNHYTSGRSPKDEINEKNDKTWNQGEAVYLEGVRCGFNIIDPLPLKCDPMHIAWLKQKGIHV